jgi:hypothetical protein
MRVKGPMHVWLRTAQANKLATHPLKSKVQCASLPLAQANSVSMALSVFHHPSSEIHRHYKAPMISIITGNLEILFRPISLRHVSIVPYKYGIPSAVTWKFTKWFSFSHIIEEILAMFNKARNFQENCW